MQKTANKYLPVIGEVGTLGCGGGEENSSGGINGVTVDSISVSLQLMYITFWVLAPTNML